MNLHIDKKAFLETKVFHGLKNLNDGFDASEIYYFSEKDFKIVLERVCDLKLGVYGIESWKDGAFFDVYSSEDYNKKPNDSDWYFKAFDDFVALDKALQYSATYFIPE